jgi:hypothetical protein
MVKYGSELPQGTSARIGVIDHARLRCLAFGQTAVITMSVGTISFGQNAERTPVVT